MGNEKSARTVSARWILERIKGGKDIRLRRANIEGDLDINTLDLPTQHVERTRLQIEMGLTEEVKIVNSSIKITNSQFQGNINFGDSFFNKDANFSGATFSGIANFSGAKFSEYAYFGGAKFTRTADFRGAEFSENRGIADFRGATFSENSGDAYFGGAKFTRDAYFRDAKFSGDANFSVATFSENSGIAEFREATFIRDAYFIGAKFSGNADFGGAKFTRDAYFWDAKFSGSADFRDAKFTRNANFWGAEFSEYANFSVAKFSENSGIAEFREATFIRDAYFIGAEFSGIANFSVAKFSGNADFGGAKFTRDAYFIGAEFSGSANFEFCDFAGKHVDFRETRFIHLEDQEYPCRAAKQAMNTLGDKEEADNYHYREMVGRRIRLQNEEPKPWVISNPFRLPFSYTVNPDNDFKKAIFKGYKILKYNIFEAFFIQTVFGYGVRPWRLVGWWFLAVIVFAVIYYKSHGIYRTFDNASIESFGESLYFSIVTSATPGYGGYRPSGFSQWIAGAQAIFGTFMWAAFITTFARKFMR